MLPTDETNPINVDQFIPFWVLTEKGLKDVPDNETWQRMLQQLMEIDWFEGTVKVVVPRPAFE